MFSILMEMVRSTLDLCHQVMPLKLKVFIWFDKFSLHTYAMSLVSHPEICYYADVWMLNIEYLVIFILIFFSTSLNWEKKGVIGFLWQIKNRFSQFWAVNYYVIFNIQIYKSILANRRMRYQGQYNSLRCNWSVNATI